MSATQYDPDAYRDSIATVAKDGSRVWIYPKQPSGKYYNYRKIFSYFLLAFLIGAPFIKVGGDPLFLFNVLEGKFILFGVVFTPQDMHLFALAMITLILFIVLFTVVFGRLFCGWACPQTIFMELVFRRIEYWIEGNASAQRKLNKAPWTPNKFFKKLLKHTIFFLIAILIANLFLSYVIGVEEVKRIISEPIALHFSGFIAMLVFSGLFYGVFAFFREQVCIAVCPYGRLQSVLLVKNSIVVMYDWIRGEPRGKIRKKRKETAEPSPQLGDCIDCTLCVQVCPTGIDIRNGTQLECVNCTACMDACDEVMEKINRPKGLIRYDSLSNIESNEKKIFTPRVWAYSFALTTLVLFQVFLFATRSEVEFLLLRTPGMLYHTADDGHISNLYNYQLTNKTSDEITDITFQLKVTDGRIKLVGRVPSIPKLESIKGAFFVEIPPDALEGRKNKIYVEVYSGEELITNTNTNFLGPIK